MFLEMCGIYLYRATILLPLPFWILHMHADTLLVLPLKEVALFLATLT